MAFAPERHQEANMSDNPADFFTAIDTAGNAMSQYMGWGISMNPTGGSHGVTAWGLPGPLEVKYDQGSPAMASAEMAIYGRPFPPVGRTYYQPLQPGANSAAGPFSFGCGLGWTFGEEGGAATFGWSVDDGAWQLIDEIFSPTRASIQVANQEGGNWLMTVQIITVLDTTATVTLFVDGVSKGVLKDGDQLPVAGTIVSLEIECDFPTPAQDGFSISYVLQPQS
jgi:hypothetical protein